MDDILRHLIRTNLNLQVTEDLIQIWQQSVTDEYQEEFFEIIGEILSERLGYLPPQSNRTNINQSINQIESLLEAYKLDEAIRECDSLLQVVPTLAEVYHYRGLAFDEKGRFDKALIDYRKAVQLNPELNDAWDDLKSVEEDIESEFQQSIMKQYLDNALDFAVEGEFENALDEIKLAIPSIPSIASPYNYLGNIFEEMGRLEEAIAAYRIAIQYNPKYYAARENLVKASYKLEENQYKHISALDIDANIEFDETIQFNLVDEDKPIPGWV